MKEIICLILITLLLSISTFMAQAAETSPTPSSVPTKKMPSDALTQQISNLKEKIASRVAELKLVEKRGIIGVVTEVKDTEITLTDEKGNTRFIDVDELTKFTDSSNKSSDISGIKKGETIAVLGRYNKQSQRLLARFVEATVIPELISGSIKEIDETNFALTVTGNSSGKDRDIDVESITKTETYSKDAGVEKSGFSKLRTGDQVFISGYPDKVNQKRIVATGILVLLDFRKTQTDDNASTPTLKPTKKSSSATTGQ